MFKRKMNNSGYDYQAHNELRLFIENDRASYDKSNLLKKNYANKVRRGKFNFNRGEVGFLNLVVNPASRRYAKEYGGNSRLMFPMKVRRGVAKSIARRNYFGGVDDDVLFPNSGLFPKI